MIALIILIIFGLGTAFFATQNTGVVHLMLGGYLVSGIPLYLVVVGAILFGVFVSWLISMVGSLSSLMSMHGKDVVIQKDEKTIRELEKKNHELSLENERLKGQKEKEEHIVSHPSLTERVRSNFV